MTITAKQDLFNETDHLSLLGRSRFAPEPAPQRGRKQEPSPARGRVA